MKLWSFFYFVFQYFLIHINIGKRNCYGFVQEENLKFSYYCKLIVYDYTSIMSLLFMTSKYYEFIFFKVITTLYLNVYMQKVLQTIIALLSVLHLRS